MKSTLSLSTLIQLPVPRVMHTDKLAPAEKSLLAFSGGIEPETRGAPNIREQSISL